MGFARSSRSSTEWLVDFSSESVMSHLVSWCLSGFPVLFLVILGCLCWFCFERRLAFALTYSPTCGNSQSKIIRFDDRLSLERARHELKKKDYKEKKMVFAPKWKCVEKSVAQPVTPGHPTRCSESRGLHSLRVMSVSPSHPQAIPVFWLLPAWRCYGNGDGAGHVWAGRANFYLHNHEISDSPPDETFIAQGAATSSHCGRFLEGLAVQQ